MATVIYPFEARDGQASPPGTRVTGLTPTWVFFKNLSTGANISQPTVTEIANGVYKFSYDPSTAEAVGQLDLGSGLTAPADRYLTVTCTKDVDIVNRLVGLADTTPDPVADVAAAVFAADPTVGSYTGNQFGSMMTKWNRVGLIAAVNDTSGTASTFKLGSGASSTSDAYKGQTITFLTGALAGQRRTILSYTGSTKAVTVSMPFTGAPANADTCQVV